MLRLLYAFCVIQNLVCLRDIRLGFDRWYAIQEASLTESEKQSPVSRFAVLRWLYAASNAAIERGSFTEEERVLYRRWELRAALPFLLLFGVMGGAWWFGVMLAASLLSRDGPGTQFHVGPSPFYWLFAALLPGFLTSVIALDGLYRILLRDRYRRFQSYFTARLGCGPRRLVRVLAVIAVAALTVSLVAGVTSFSRFTDTGVEIHRPFSFRSHFYEYSRVRTIAHRATSQTPSGSTVERPHHVILFDDGTTWSSLEGLREPDPARDGQIARLVSKRSKRSIIRQP